MKCGWILNLKPKDKSQKGTTPHEESFEVRGKIQPRRKNIEAGRDEKNEMHCWTFCYCTKFSM